MKTVLLCEDDEDMVQLTRLVVERAGYRLERAADGRQAVDMGLKQNPELILMDIRMPNMDGISAARVLRDKGYTRPIVILTSSEKAEDRKRAGEAGCSGFILKTLAMSDVCEALEKLVGSDEDFEVPET
jgi:CheY-like chemotaxis protein